MTTTNRSLLTLTVAILLLTGYNFLGAAWTPAAGTPPANNTDAPVNIGATTQAKSGNLSANIFAATTEMRSNRYCDALGENCFDVDDVGGTSATTTNACYYDVQQITECGWTSPSCPSGWSQLGAAIKGENCSIGQGDNKAVYSVTCGRNICNAQATQTTGEILGGYVTTYTAKQSEGRNGCKRNNPITGNCTCQTGYVAIGAKQNGGGQGPDTPIDSLYLCMKN